MREVILGGAEISRYGALQPLMDDPTVEEIWINSPQRIFIARNGVSELTNIVMDGNQIQALMDRILLWSGRRIDLSQPFVDARLPDGSRLHIAIPEVTAEHWAINIRKHLLRNLELTDLAKLGVMSPEIVSLLHKSDLHSRIQGLLAQDQVYSELLLSLLALWRS